MEQMELVIPRRAGKRFAPAALAVTRSLVPGSSSRYSECGFAVNIS